MGAFIYVSMWTVGKNEVVYVNTRLQHKLWYIASFSSVA